MDYVLTVESYSPQGTTTTHQTGSGHRLLTDEPESRGGTDAGPTPLETALSSLTGCLSVITALTARAMQFQHQELVLKAQGHFDPTGRLGATGVRRHFSEVNLEIRVRTDESRNRLDELARQVEDRCPVHNLFRAAGVTMTTKWLKVCADHREDHMSLAPPPSNGRGLGLEERGMLERD